MGKVLIVMDDINYRGGAHFATFNVANYLAQLRLDVDIFSPVVVSDETKQYLSENVNFVKKVEYSSYNYIIVPFENSKYREEVSHVRNAIKIQWIHIDFDKWKDIVGINIEQEKNLFSKYDSLIFVSEHNKNGFLKNFPELADKCQVVYNFLDEKLIRAKGDMEFDEIIMQKKDKNQMNIVLSGRLEPQKAYHRVIDAAKILQEENLKIEWFILGTGYEYTDLRKRCRKYNLKNIHFLGYRKNPYPFVKHADLFGILSLYEGLALVIAESLTLGTPVISTRSGGVEEVLSSEYGWIIDNNIYSIVDNIRAIYRNRDLLNNKKNNLINYSYDNSNIEKRISEFFLDCKGGEVMKYMPKQELIKEESPKVSIIVPVYNMEKYLKECLDSLVEQTLDSYEIIVVNDGSKDESWSIIEEYRYKYSDKIRAFTIENSGLGEARNYGISKARGDYLGFVDSDDTVQLNMFQKMYEAAIKNDADCVMSDYIAFWENGKREYVTSVMGEDIDRFDILKYSAKYGVVNACTKLVKKELFDKIKFPKGFYEDLATIPILLSYAKNVYYERDGLYNYRQRSGSITSVKSNDSRLFDCYAAWDRILKFSNPVYRKEITFAVYWSINFFCTNFLDEFTFYSKKYYEEHKSVFMGNEYILESIKNREFMDFNKIPEIPKIIHYCWFGNNEKNDLIRHCIQSWKRNAPEYKIIEWNETNCNLEETEYVKKAYEEKKWAFVSDYFRLKALKEYGGIYMDTDMELMKPLDPYLCNRAFFAFETPLFVHAGIIGAIPNCDIINDILLTYQEDKFEINSDDIPETIPRRITAVLEKKTNLVKNGKTQLLNNGVKVYSANIMTMNFHDGKCVANHHYEGNWMDKSEGDSWNYGYEVLKNYFTWDLLNENAESSGVNGGYSYKALYDQVKNSTCWKVTKPLRIMMNGIKGKGFKDESYLTNENLLNYEEMYKEILGSTCWRITKPLREIKDLLNK